MNRPIDSVIGIEPCTIESFYGNPESISAPVQDWADQPRGICTDSSGRIVSIPIRMQASKVRIESDKVTVRVRDLTSGLSAMAAQQFAWLEDLGDDPVVLTRDFYEVFLACQSVRRAS